MASAKQPLPPGTFPALVAMAMAVFVVANDFTAISVALPAMEADFDASLSDVQWVITAYALVFGVLIVTGGRLADLFGRRRMFFVGAGVFAAFSVLGGAAQETWQLIACRAVMGVGGALIWPAVLGMTYAILPADRAGLAGGLVIGVAGIGNAFGPLLGGALTEGLSWRWIFFLNLPIAVLACVVTARYVKAEVLEAAERRVDYAGMAAISVGIVSLLLALDQAPVWGWGDVRVLGLVALAVVGAVAFWLVERRAGAAALVPPDVMRSSAFSSACVVVMLMSFTFFALLLYLPQFMQKILGWTPLEAGLGLLPLMATFALVSFGAGALYERLGAKPIVALGAACFPVGAFLVTVVDAGSSYGALVPGMVVVGVGIGLFYSSVTTAAVTALDPSRASLAGGIVYMFQLAGGSIGIALTTTVFASAAKSEVHEDRVAARLSEAQERDVDGLLAGTESARAVTRELPGLAGRLEELAREGFVAGFTAGIRLDAALAVLGFVLALLFVGGRLRRRSPAPPADSPAAG